MKKLPPEVLARSEKLPASGCPDCGKYKAITESDPYRGDGIRLPCEHVVCHDCWPYCEVCDPIPF